MSKVRFLIVVSIVAFLAGGVAFQLAGRTEAKAESEAAKATISKEPILVNITRGKNELHAVSMALALAQSALKDGRSAASVFLNVEAPVFAAKDLGEDVKYADFPPIQKMLADFMAAGGRVYVCGHCAHVVRLKQEDLIDGAKALGQGELFAAMKPGTVVFSY